MLHLRYCSETNEQKAEECGGKLNLHAGRILNSSKLMNLISKMTCLVTTALFSTLAVGQEKNRQEVDKQTLPAH
jgi:hypothetical protein